jgi:hypothetical protein
LNREDEDGAPVKLEKGEDEATGTCLGSEDAGAADEKPKGDGSVVGAARLDVNPLAGAAELGEDPKPAKLDGGIGIVAGVEVAGLEKENGAAGAEGLLGGFGALCVFA